MKARFRCLVAGLAFVACATPAAIAYAQGSAVRPEVGKPLQAAQALIKQRKGREALAEIAKAESVPNRTANENQLINQMKGSAALAAGDNDAVIRAYEPLLEGSRGSPQMVQAVAVAYYQKKDYAKAAQWTNRYFKEGGNDPAMRSVLLQSYYLGNDCNSVNRLLGDKADADSNKRASEEELQILANCYLRQKDTGGYVNAIEKLVVHYPKKEYWTDLLARVQKKPGFSDRLGVNVYRLRFATGNAGSTNDYMEMAQLAMQAGVPAEAKAIIEQGYAKGALGKGDQAERHARLRDLVQKAHGDALKNRAQEEKEALASKDGNDLVRIGLNYVYEGNAAKGLPLVEQGIKKGGLKRPEDAKLRLGEAQLYAGQKQRGVQTLREVKGNDGAADIARLWVLHARA
ncbi:MAG TPA: tetratricopeptide repeat protein [Usitatibacter sp.]|nr:tetratricopeptide repeat protein [Usitatibacter sp.]